MVSIHKKATSELIDNSFLSALLGKLRYRMCKLSKWAHRKGYKYLGTDCFLIPYQGTYDIDIRRHKHIRR